VGFPRSSLALAPRMLWMTFKHAQVVQHRAWRVVPDGSPVKARSCRLWRCWELSAGNAVSHFRVLFERSEYIFG
jgi:hypothetical protein